MQVRVEGLARLRVDAFDVVALQRLGEALLDQLQTRHQAGGRPFGPLGRDLLGVADSLERALQAAPKEAEGPSASLVSGLELIQKSFTQALESNNVKRVDPQAGEAFDPNLHQAMMEQPSDTVQGGQ
ncbi:MAG: nucleotide exchange factor GrpE, partial [Brevundimonas sp.]